MRELGDLVPGRAVDDLWLAYRLRQLGREAEALKVYEMGVQLHSDEYLFHQHLGNLLLMGPPSLRDVRRAESAFRKALSGAPNDYYSNLYLGVALLRNGGIDEAISQFNECLRLSLENGRQAGEACFALSLAFSGLGATDVALEFYRRGLKSEPHASSSGENYELLSRNLQLQAANAFASNL